MKKLTFFLFIFTILIISGCNRVKENTITNTTPPPQIEEKTKKTLEPTNSIETKEKGILYIQTNKNPSEIFLYKPEKDISTTIAKINSNTNVQYFDNNIFFIDGEGLKKYSIRAQKEEMIPITSHNYKVLPNEKIVYSTYYGEGGSGNNTSIHLFDLKTLKDKIIVKRYQFYEKGEDIILENYLPETNEISILAGYWEMGYGNAIRYRINLENGKIKEVGRATGENGCLYTEDNCNKKEIEESEAFGNFLNLGSKKLKCLDYKIESGFIDGTYKIIIYSTPKKEILDATFIGCLE